MLQQQKLMGRSVYRGGIDQTAEIIDQWGVPHIYANDHYDAFFVQVLTRLETGFGRLTPGATRTRSSVRGTWICLC